ncbi:hypothetical protein [Bradyrhizobium sp. BR 1433]|uniref:hypothetical protein n=1 Tax=Bradyrhizobium sp. BR 1433 TaxID=3447967 RepID=UPI003EE59519
MREISVRIGFEVLAGTDRLAVALTNAAATPRPVRFSMRQAARNRDGWRMPRDADAALKSISRLFARDHAPRASRTA